MKANSRPVASNQKGIHSRLGKVVRTHLETSYRAPLQPHNIAAFETLRERIADISGPLILDSFCGTGHSTAALAEAYPNHFVIGIDQSASRLGRHPSQSSNYCLTQANCEAIWAQLADAGIRAASHYLFYPNPWPKAKHLQRRIHGHPGFFDLTRLGGRVELRSNWQLYVEEFGVAMTLTGARGYVGRLPADEAGISLFERKYHESGQPLWVYKGQIHKN